MEYATRVGGHVERTRAMLNFYRVVHSLEVCSHFETYRESQDKTKAEPAGTLLKPFKASFRTNLEECRTKARTVILVTLALRVLLVLFLSAF